MSNYRIDSRSQDQIEKSLSYHSTFALDEGVYEYKLVGFECTPGKFGDQFQLDLKIMDFAKRFWIPHTLQMDIDKIEDKEKKRFAQKNKDKSDLILYTLLKVNGKEELFDSGAFSDSDVIGLDKGFIKLSKYEKKNQDLRSSYRWQNGIDMFVEAKEEEVDHGEMDADIPF